MLEIRSCCLVVVDVQGKLAQLMSEKESLFRNIRILIQAAGVLDIPILWCQQVPEALGPTVPEIAELLTGHEPTNKASFSCCGVEEFNVRLEASNRRQVLLCGIETHVCIYQTALDLMSGGLDVTVVPTPFPPGRPRTSRLPSIASRPKAPPSLARKWSSSNCSKPPNTPNFGRSPNSSNSQPTILSHFPGCRSQAIYSCYALTVLRIGMSITQGCSRKLIAWVSAAHHERWDCHVGQATGNVP